MSPVQDVPVERFLELRDGDVLFVDTSHVIKTGGDVQYLYHEVLPRLADGVVVHVHDIFLPWDYPDEWVLVGRGWNEQYVLQSFLSFNDTFHILLGIAWMSHFHAAALAQAIPGIPRDHAGWRRFVLASARAASHADRSSSRLDALGIVGEHVRRTSSWPRVTGLPRVRRPRRAVRPVPRNPLGRRRSAIASVLGPEALSADGRRDDGQPGSKALRDLAFHPSAVAERSHHHAGVVDERLEVFNPAGEVNVRVN